MNKLADSTMREQALDTRHSFIVQAPAGSGKTELLTQRFLALLANVQSPEEIIAITFTRKAASEMRHRIVRALITARDPEPSGDHQKKTWRLAKNVLARNEELRWQLLKNANRLRIQTIDAFCAWLIHQQPLQSEQGLQINVTDEANLYYTKAVENLFNHADSNQAWASALDNLLLHLDNQQQRLSFYLQRMLAYRDQWLSHIVSAQSKKNLRQQLENSLQSIQKELLEQVNVHCPISLMPDVLQLARYAAQHVGKDHPIAACADLPQDQKEFDCEHWQQLTRLFLTDKLQWRKRFDKTVGFPAANSVTTKEERNYYQAMKRFMQQTAEQLTGYDAFRQSLANVLMTPPLNYTNQQWDIVRALTTLLPILAAELKLVFQEHQVVDFIEISSAASHLLGDMRAPTDLALRLDYRIQHILVDEFQDTSLHQFQLIAKLVNGWQIGDGRTLFVVGDPMQSIYRFRAAEVGLFIRAKTKGISDLPLQFLKLSSNFRANSDLIQWLNHSFSQVLPTHEDFQQGAIRYQNATAVLPASTQQAIHYHPCASELAQAQTIVRSIQQLQQRAPDASIAILVKARSQLSEILHALQTASIAYQALELDQLAMRPTIQDLWALTQALLQLENRIAWLSILRAPYCGLNLHDLYALANDPRYTIHQQLSRLQHLTQLSDDARLRLMRIHPILSTAIQQRGRRNFRDHVEHTWKQLGGELCLQDVQQKNDAADFFDLLERYDHAPLDCHYFEQRLQTLFARSNTQANVHVMTIHKAKGLEFDVVFLPCLEKMSDKQDPSLLLWTERAAYQGDDHLVLAPIKAASSKLDTIYRYLHYEEQQKNNFERTRLLYVAASRAKQQLHLLATTNDKAPSRKSFLGLLWPVISESFQRQAVIEENAKPETAIVEQDTIQRLPSIWFNNNPVTATQVAFGTRSTYQVYQQQHKRHIGTVIHEQLRLIAEQGLQHWNEDKIKQSAERWRQRLLELGVSESALSDSIQVIETALLNSVTDDYGRWILSGDHQDARCEYSLTIDFSKSKQQVILDRTFIDDQDQRWIIDYKTAHTEGDIETFLQTEQQHYLPQLQLYAEAMRHMETRAIKLALYYPLMKRFCPYPSGMMNVVEGLGL